jgi:hypothetical protein
MSAKPLKTAYELGEMIVEQAILLHGPWPDGMTLFVFDDAYGWTASISRPSSEADNFYRTSTLDLIAGLAAKYDLDVPRLSEDLSDFAFSNPTLICVILKPQGNRHGKRPAKKQSGSQETKKGEDQGNCRCAEPKSHNVAADFGHWKKEIERAARAFLRETTIAAAVVTGIFHDSANRAKSKST